MSDAGGSKGAKKVGGSNKVGIKPEPASTQAGVQKKKAAPKSKATENASAAVAAAAAAGGGARLHASVANQWTLAQQHSASMHADFQLVCLHTSWHSFAHAA